MKLSKLLVLLAAVVFAVEPCLVSAQAPAADVVEAAADEAAEEGASEEGPAPLAIGDDAPPIDVEHWVQDGGGRFKPVTEFEPGNVYIVEFWATWCGPCIASMPHISELQEKYADQRVQVVSISDEPLETVTQFLAKASQADPEKTYGDITANYCLTTDPDRSEHAAYMEAAGQNGIPTAFIVGKDSKIEWIGHPMGMDEVVEQIVADAWDREAYRKRLEMEQKLESQLQEIAGLAYGGKADEAYAAFDALVAEIEDEDLKARVESARGQIDRMVFEVALEGDQERAVETLPRAVEGLGGSPAAAGMLCSLVVRRIDSGDEVSEALAAAAIEQLEAALENDPGMYEAPLRMLLAKLLKHTGDAARAVEVMQQAIESAPEEQKEELQRVLEDLEGAAESEEAAAK
jgi:thiol-disulfide isomerase/thioredoxin